MFVLTSVSSVSMKHVDLIHPGKAGGAVFDHPLDDQSDPAGRGGGGRGQSKLGEPTIGKAYSSPQIALISYVTSLAPSSLTATGISLMSSIKWKMGKGVSRAVVVMCPDGSPAFWGTPARHGDEGLVPGGGRRHHRPHPALLGGEQAGPGQVGPAAMVLRPRGEQVEPGKRETDAVTQM